MGRFVSKRVHSVFVILTLLLTTLSSAHCEPRICDPRKSKIQSEIKSILHEIAGDDLQSFFGFVPKIIIEDSEAPNARMEGRDKIVLTKGLLLSLSKPSELAFVLLHEIGHSVKGHSWKRDLLTGSAVSRLVRNEIEADAYAVSLLKKIDISASVGISVLSHLRSDGLKTNGNYDKIFPSLIPRIEALRNAQPLKTE